MDWSQRHFRRFVFWVALKSRIQSRDNGIEAVRKYWGLVSFIDVPKNSNVADIFSAKRTCLYVICPLFALCMDLKVDWSFPCQSMGDFPSAAMWCVMSLWPLGGHCGSWPGTFFTESFSRLQLWSPKKKKYVLQLGQMESQDILAQMNEETDMAVVQICQAESPLSTESVGRDTISILKKSDYPCFRHGKYGTWRSHFTFLLPFHSPLAQKHITAGSVLHGTHL